MSRERPGSLLDRHLIIVTGKGGTGKTSVAAALGLAAARSGRKVLLAEMARGEHLTPILAPDQPDVGYAGRELLPGLRVMKIDPFAALAEYLGLQFGGRAIVERVMQNRGFRQLMTASPGWRELITLGKVWHLEQMTDEEGGRLYDLIVVDAPATGHGVTFLDVPRVVVSAVQTGPLRRNAMAVQEMILDQERTLLLPVALAEELPVRETQELLARVRAEIGMAVDRVVINAMMPEPLPVGCEDLSERLGALSDDVAFGPLPSASVMRRCVDFWRSRRELHQGYAAEIAETTALPVVALPYLSEGIRGVDDLARLGGALLETPA